MDINGATAVFCLEPIGYLAIHVFRNHYCGLFFHNCYFVIYLAQLWFLGNHNLESQLPF